MIGRRILGTVMGVGCSTATIMAVEKIGHVVLGTPGSPAEATPAMHAAVLAAWVLGTSVGGFIGSSIARWTGTAWIVAGLVVLGVIANALSFPHPWWMVAGGVMLPLVVAWLIGRGRPAPVSPRGDAAVQADV